MTDWMLYEEAKTWNEDQLQNRVDAFWYIMAEDDQEAVNVKPDWGAIDLEATLARDCGVDIGWWNAMPFNSDDDRMCGEIIHD